MSKAINLLKQQLEQIDSLRHPPAYNAQYKVWENTTKRILVENYDKEYVELFEYAGPNIIPAEEEHYGCFLEHLDEQKQLLESFISEKERFESDNSVLFSDSYPLSSYQFHKEIENVSNNLFKDNHYAQAVEEAFKRVIKEVKNIVKEKLNEDLDGDKLMNKAFGCDNNIPLIKFNSLSNKEEKDEQRGIMYLFKGIVGIRNRKAHDNVDLNNSKRATEYLALGSLLFGLLEEHTNTSKK